MQTSVEKNASYLQVSFTSFKARLRVLEIQRMESVRHASFYKFLFPVKLKRVWIQLNRKTVKLWQNYFQPNSKLKASPNTNIVLAFLLFLHVIFIIWGSNTIKIIGKVILLRSVIYTLDLKHSTNVQHKCDASLKFEVQLSYISFMTIFRTLIHLPALCFTLACELQLLWGRFSVQLTDDTFGEHLLLHSTAIQSDVKSFYST